MLCKNVQGVGGHDHSLLCLLYAMMGVKVVVVCQSLHVVRWCWVTKNEIRLVKIISNNINISLGSVNKHLQGQDRKLGGRGISVFSEDET